jgi:hypothetical protein
VTGNHVIVLLNILLEIVLLNMFVPLSLCHQPRGHCHQPCGCRQETRLLIL